MNRISEFLVLILSIFVFSSCESSGSLGFDDPTPRMLMASVWEVTVDSVSDHSHSYADGFSPLSIALTSGAGVKLPEDERRRRDQLVDLYELDFGDGSGWQDITQLYYVMDFDYDDGVDLNLVARHTYTEPGVYLIRARATYWDGEVVTLDGNTPIDRPQPITVTVTAPELEG